MLEISEVCAKCRVDVEAFIARHPYEDCRLDTLRKECEAAYHHMFGDPFATCGRRDFCWECISHFDEKLNGLL